MNEKHRVYLWEELAQSRTGRSPDYFLATPMTNLSFFDKVYILVQQIPYGKVTYYGKIADMLEVHGAARTVGWALAALTPGQAEIVPWQRVINKAGRCSISNMDHSSIEQQSLLESEGVQFNDSGYTDFGIFGWEGLNPDEVRELLTRVNCQ